MSTPLTIRFATDIDSAKRGIASLAASLATNAASMAASLKTVVDNIQTMQQALSMLRTAAAPAALAFAAFEAIKFAINETTKAVEDAQKRLEELVKIGQGAQAAAVGTTFFQS